MPAAATPETHTLSLHDALPILSTGALQQFLPPPLVLKIPIDRFRDSIPSIAAGVPVQLAFGEAGINCITPIIDRKSTRLNSSHVSISYAVFCLKKNRRKTANGR